MKNYLKTFALSLLVLSVACTKNDDSANPNPNEEVAKTVADNLIIKGGTKKTGTPPTPNEAISLDISGSSTIALLGEGFDVSLDSDAPITGAYLIFKSTDDTAADGYYDIDLSANTTGKNIIKKKKTTLSKVSKAAKFLVDETLDVDFNTQIEPGTFCYEICVYDAEGNISAPQELCVTVESWGEFSDLNGEWSYTKYERVAWPINIEEPSLDTIAFLAGEIDCGDIGTFGLVDCNNGSFFKYSIGCETVLSGKLVFNTDGTYSYIGEFESYDIDYDASAESCMFVEDNIATVYTSLGNWAYNSQAKRLILVEYSYSEESSDGEKDEDMYEPGDGELLFDGIATISGGTLSIFETDEDEPGDSYTSYWDKQ